MIKADEIIREYRKAYGLSQEQLARAVYLDKIAISNYENAKRLPNLNILESIVNVFGYTLDLTLIEKKGNKKDVNFYKKKNRQEILDMSKEDLTDYIYITVEDANILANICKVDADVINILPLSKLKELISIKVEKSSNLELFFKLNNMYFGVENEMAEFINNVKYHLKNESTVDKEDLDKTKFLLIETDYSREGYYYLSNVLLLDKDKNDLNVDIDDIHGDDIPLDDGLDNKLGFYLMENVSEIEL